MQDKDKMGIIVALVTLVAVVIGFWALMKVVIALIPVLIIVALVGLAVWVKCKS